MSDTTDWKAAVAAAQRVEPIDPVPCASCEETSVLAALGQPCTACWLRQRSQ